MNQLVREVLETKLEDKPADIEVAVDFDAPSSIVSADRDRLARLCQALWQNAVEAMPQGGTLSWSTKLDSAPAGLLTELETENQSPFIRLRVSDTGLGMDEKTKAQIFDPFFTSKAGKGRGLGLTEVYETVADLRGFIEVASQPGQGACVEIYLPVAVGSLSAAADVAVAERPKRLLVVDDEAMLREILKNFLEQEGYEVVAAAAGEEALQICSRPGENIDAVILDMTLPGIDGMETFNGLKAINDQIKVVIATGDPYRQSVHDLMRQGASGMLSKPFRPQHLSEVIKQVLA